MRRRIVELALLCLCAGQTALQAQEFKLFDRQVQIHGFASQGFVHTNDNNWLTMNTSQGSGAMTDFGVNVSASLTDKLWVGAQGYDRNLGELGQYHPSLDWAVADYRFKNWFGIRGGKVKTRLGLYNDTQDQDFLRTFALLPQSIYTIDLREEALAHLGGDVYGGFSLGRNLGEVSYTAFTGHSSISLHDGFEYLAAAHQLHYSSYGGLQYGGDLRWDTPLKGLLIGVSRMDEDLSGEGIYTAPLFPGISSAPETDKSRPNWINQFYCSYSAGKLRIDSEYRRTVALARYATGGTVLLENLADARGWYVSGTYRIMKRLAVGSYYSRYSITSVSAGPFAALLPDQTDTSLPANHVYDKVITASMDFKKFWNVKLEGHFMNGYGTSSYPDGFYQQVNPQGFSPNTNTLVLKTGVNF
jgi:hypothetical protein